ncbi:hypothetical protein GQR58_019430 [Nymphon striatum]|nr:hypothetical protein GQR58_019430 [Nymphon striatum]
MINVKEFKRYPFCYATLVLSGLMPIEVDDNGNSKIKWKNLVPTEAIKTELSKRFMQELFQDSVFCSIGIIFMDVYPCNLQHHTLSISLKQMVEILRTDLRTTQTRIQCLQFFNEVLQYFRRKKLQILSPSWGGIGMVGSAKGGMESETLRTTVPEAFIPCFLALEPLTKTSLFSNMQQYITSVTGKVLLYKLHYLERSTRKLFGHTQDQIQSTDIYNLEEWFTPRFEGKRKLDQVLYVNFKILQKKFQYWLSSVEIPEVTEVIDTVISILIIWWWTTELQKLTQEVDSLKNVIAKLCFLELNFREKHFQQKEIFKTITNNPSSSTTLTLLVRVVSLYKLHYLERSTRKLFGHTQDQIQSTDIYNVEEWCTLRFEGPMHNYNYFSVGILENGYIFRLYHKIGSMRRYMRCELKINLILVNFNKTMIKFKEFERYPYCYSTLVLSGCVPIEVDDHGNSKIKWKNLVPTVLRWMIVLRHFIICIIFAITDNKYYLEYDKEAKKTDFVKCFIYQHAQNSFTYYVGVTLVDIACSCYHVLPHLTLIWMTLLIDFNIMQLQELKVKFEEIRNVERISLEILKGFHLIAEIKENFAKYFSFTTLVWSFASFFHVLSHMNFIWDNPRVTDVVDTVISILIIWWWTTELQKLTQEVDSLKNVIAKLCFLHLNFREKHFQQRQTVGSMSKLTHIDLSFGCDYPRQPCNMNNGDERDEHSSENI